jgi:hypothetical protein
MKKSLNTKFRHYSVRYVAATSKGLIIGLSIIMSLNSLFQFNSGRALLSAIMGLISISLFVILHQANKGALMGESYDKISKTLILPERKD